MDPHATTKRCSKCKQDKALLCFGRDASARDGKQRQCKQCLSDYYIANSERVRERVRQWALDHPERVKSNTRARSKREQQSRHESAQQRTEKPCKVCGTIKPLDAFPERQRFLDGRGATCNLCRREQHRISNTKWGRNNPSKRRENVLRRRARIMNTRAGKVSYDRIYARDNGICYLCNLPVSFKECQFDHVIPLSRGGAHSEVNIAVTHALCNQKKNNRLVTYEQGTLL